MLALERSGAAIEHHLAIGHARGELTEPERQTGSERTLTQGHELVGRMHEIADRSSHDTADTHSEQALGGGVQVRDQKRLVENDDRGREALENVARIRSALGAPRRADWLETGC